jgi:hypothetical protein
MLEDKTEDKTEENVWGDVNELLEIKREMISWNRAYDIAYAALINHAIGGLRNPPCIKGGFGMEVSRICARAHEIANRTILQERWNFAKEEDLDRWL